MKIREISLSPSRVGIVLLLLCPAVLRAQSDHRPPTPTAESTVATDDANEPVYKRGSGVTMPLPVYQPNPEYSTEAARKRVEGTVTLLVVVTSKGDVRSVRVTNGLGSGLDEKATEAAEKWKFKPATKDGKPVAIEIAVEMSFHLQH